MNFFNKSMDLANVYELKIVCHNCGIVQKFNITNLNRKTILKYVDNFLTEGGWTLVYGSLFNKELIIEVEDEDSFSVCPRCTRLVFIGENLKTTIGTSGSLTYFIDFDVETEEFILEFYYEKKVKLGNLTITGSDEDLFSFSFNMDKVFLIKTDIEDLFDFFKKEVKEQLRSIEE